MPNVRRLFVLGTDAMQEDIAREGYTLCTDDPEDEPDVVVVGFDTGLTYHPPDMAMARGCGALGVLVLTGETTAKEAAESPLPDLVVRDLHEFGQLLSQSRQTARNTLP